MGFRTVLALSNDLAHEWDKDPLLGQKIWQASCRLPHLDTPRDYEFNYGQIIEQVHADVQSLIVAEHYGATIMTRTSWYRNQTVEERNLSLLNSMADKLGYRVVKKSEKKV